MVLPTSIALQAELAGVGGGWTDLSADEDVLANIEVQYGIRGGGPLDRIASVGTMTWAMKNAATRNSGGVDGYYTPGHADVRSGWDIGIAIRLAITYGGTTYYKFRGTLVSAEPDSALYGPRRVRCLANDWIDDAAICLVKDTAVQLNKRSDELITTVVTQCVGRQPTSSSYEVGQSTFAFAMDNLRDEKTPALRALSDIVLAEAGYLYMKGDTTAGGKLKYEDRHFRPLASSVATFNETMFNIMAIRSRDDIINHVIAMVHPRKVDAAATTVLYELTPTETVPSLVPGETIILTVFFREATGRFVRVGGDSIVTPVASTDYIGNSAADGSGSDLTASLGLVFASTSNAASLAFTNNHASATVYITTLQVRGKAVQDRFEIGVEAANEASETAVGERDLMYDMIFEDRSAIAKGMADWIVNQYSTLRMVINEMVLKGNHTDALMTQVLAREPGDKITLTGSLIGISAVAYFINGVRLSIRPGKLIDCSWVLAPADQQLSWILEDPVAGLLELTTTLGFA